jgi:PAS domain S-box-containing protein
VLHSYHHGFSWTDNISRGIQSAFADQRDEVELRHEFLDARRIHTNDYFRKLKSLYRLKYAGTRIDVIICSDDHALDFVLGPGQDVFRDVPVVFLSVSGYEPSMRLNRKLTGLVESIDIRGTLETALRLHPETREVAVITDMTRTGRALKAKADSVFRNFRDRVLFRYLEDLTVEELSEQVAGLSSDTIVFLFIFSRDKAGRVFSHERNLEILSRHCEVPIYAVWEFYLGHGILGGKLTSGETEGRMAGAMAVRILRGEKASDIPLEQSPTQYMFDHRQMERFGISESQLPAGSVLTNRPPSLYEEHRRLVWAALVIIAGLSGLVGLLSVNILRRRRAEEALRESEEKYRDLVENANDAICVVQDGRMKFHNRKTRELLGYTAEELAKIEFLDLIHPEDRDVVFEKHRRRLEGDQFQSTYSFRALSRGGETLWAEINAILILWEEEPAVLCFLRNITEQKRLESQLQQAQKMEAVGTLAGGVAHDFNNLLQAIQGYAELVLYDKEPSDPDHASLAEIRSAAKRGGELTRQLLTFSRRVESRIQPTNLSREVERVGKLLERTLPKMIDIELRLTRELKTVHADPYQIEQVVMNLAVNARDAMPDGGRLTIETAEVTLDEAYCRTHVGTRAGDYVTLVVSDTGQGMDRATLEHIFEPFYTTKGVGEGTGLGLAMVYGIVRGHNGFITCYSEPGQGSTFTMYLPVVEREAEQKAPVRTGTPVRGGSETILLVDDEDTLRDLGEQLLTRFGYNVLTASDGETALEIYRRKMNEIDLVVLDLIMPGMGGVRCLDKLLEENPGVKIVVASGYSVDDPTREAIDAGARGFVSKPYDIAEMHSILREVLDQD